MSGTNADEDAALRASAKALEGLWRAGYLMPERRDTPEDRRIKSDALAAIRRLNAQAVEQALVEADRLLTPTGLPWWITLEATLRLVVSAKALEKEFYGVRAMETAMEGAQRVLAKIDAIRGPQV